MVYVTSFEQKSDPQILGFVQNVDFQKCSQSGVNAVEMLRVSLAQFMVDVSDLFVCSVLSATEIQLPFSYEYIHIKKEVSLPHSV
jgi:hypothetical protein